MKQRYFYILIFSILCGCNKKALDAPKPDNNSKPKKTIIFFGDSITLFAEHKNGFIDLLNSYLTSTKLDSVYELKGQGVSGNELKDLLNRVEVDVINYTPTKVFIYIGINDVWHNPNIDTNTEKEFKENYIDLVNKIKEDTSVTVILCTPTVIGEKKDLANFHDVNLEKYASIVKEVATTTSCQLCDLRTIFVNYIEKENINDANTGILTTDGVHLNDVGNRIVADSFIPYLGK